MRIEAVYISIFAVVALATPENARRQKPTSLAELLYVMHTFPTRAYLNLPQKIEERWPNHSTGRHYLQKHLSLRPLHSQQPYRHV
jgi:hypothetical protein